MLIYWRRERDAYTNDNEEKEREMGTKERGIRYRKLIRLMGRRMRIEKIRTNYNIRIEIFLSFFPWSYCQTKSLLKFNEHENILSINLLPLLNFLVQLKFDRWLQRE